MPINKEKLVKAFKRAGRVKGVRMPETLGASVERLLVSRQLALWDHAVNALIELTPEPTTDAVVLDLAQAAAVSLVNSIYRQYAGLSKLNEEIKKRYDSGNKQHRAMFIAAINGAIGVSVKDLLHDEKSEKAVKGALKWSTDLIKSLDGEMKTRLLKEFFEGIAKGKTQLDIRKLIDKSRQVSAYRSRLIARDQTSKLFANLSRIRQTDIGVERYHWEDVGDGAVRDLHKRLAAGGPYRWDEPTEDGFPGDAVLCRCTAGPVLASISLDSLTNRRELSIL